MNDNKQTANASKNINPFAKEDPFFVNMVMMDTGWVVQELQRLVDIHNEPVENHHHENHDFPPWLVNLKIGFFGKCDFKGHQPKIENGREEDNIYQAEKFNEHQVRGDFCEVK